MGAFKDVAVFLDPEPESVVACRLAATLSEHWQAQLIAVFSAPVIACHAWLRGESIGHAIDEYQEVIAAGERRGRTEFESLCRRHGIVGEWRALHVELSEELVLHARYAGLSVLARSALTGAPLADLPEQLVLGSGRPTLLLPPTCDPARAQGRCIAVGWNATPEAARAVWDAMPLLTAAEEVWGLVVEQDRHDADFKDTRGEDLARHLARYGAKVGVKLFRAPSGDVSGVLREALNELSADLLVLGAYGHPRMSELLFGGVTQWALREAHIPTLLSR